MTDMTNEAIAAQLSESELIAELERRGVFVSAWNRNDFSGPITDDEGLTDKDDAFVARAAEVFAKYAEEGLADILGSRGNNFLADKWLELRSYVIAEVEAELTPSAGPRA